MSSVQADIDLDIKGVELNITVCADIDSDRCIENKEYFWTNTETNKQKQISSRLATYIEKHFESHIDEVLYEQDIDDYDYEYDAWKERFND